VVAAEDVVFGFTEVNLGIVPAVISPYVVARIGLSAARELFVTGTRFGAARARELGLVNAVAPTEELDRTVDHYIDELRTSAPGAVAAAKKLVRTVFGRPGPAALADACEILADRRASDEARAGVAAFLMKQQPPWAKS
jgi:methylglutaconyl-CoA hydratase